MSIQAYKEILSHNEYLKGYDNLFNNQFEYQPEKAGSLMLYTKKDDLYTNVRSCYITFQQYDDKKSVLNGGKLISFYIKSQPNACIEQLIYHIGITNYLPGPYSFNTIYNLINYIEIFNDNKTIEKLDSQELFMTNLLQVKQDTYQLQNSLKGLNPTTLAANGSAVFMIDINCFLTKQGIPMSSLGDLKIDIKFNPDNATANIDSVQLSTSEIMVFYYEITDKQDSYFRSLKCIDNRYLQIDHASYNWNNITAGNSFKFNLTQDAVIPFMLFYIQNKSDNDSFTTQYNNFVPVVSFELLGKNNQSTMNGVIMDQTLNLFQFQKHFQQLFHIINPASSYYNNIYMLNFCLNPELAMKRNYVGGQEITDNDYQLKITVGTNISQAVINVFLFNYQMTHIERKKITFYDN
ncbi:hypothetical protein ABPG74_005751 [Tetrahymena malaccensis]